MNIPRFFFCIDFQFRILRMDQYKIIERYTHILKIASSGYILNSNFLHISSVIFNIFKSENCRLLVPPTYYDWVNL
jgi:hypothetical protein